MQLGSGGGLLELDGAGFDDDDGAGLLVLASLVAGGVGSGGELTLASSGSAGGEPTLASGTESVGRLEEREPGSVGPVSPVANGIASGTGGVGGGPEREW